MHFGRCPSPSLTRKALQGYTVPDMPQPPRSVIHKYASHVDQVPGASAHPLDLCAGCAGFGMRLGSFVMGVRIDRALSQEAVFYRDAAPALRRLGVALPVVYHAEIEGGHRGHGCCFLCCCCDCCCCSVGGATTRTSLLQEDLGARGLDSIHVMAPEAMPLPALRTAVQMLAKVHAWGWKGQPSAVAHRGQPPSLWSALITGQNPVQRSAVKSFATDR